MRKMQQLDVNEFNYVIENHANEDSIKMFAKKVSSRFIQNEDSIKCLKKDVIDMKIKSHFYLMHLIIYVKYAGKYYEIYQKAFEFYSENKKEIWKLRTCLVLRYRNGTVNRKFCIVMRQMHEKIYRLIAEQEEGISKKVKKYGLLKEIIEN